MSSIQRQFSLPNCTLLIEGFSDRAKTGATESRPLITTLMNAECRFAGQGSTLQGGRDFLESLVNATSFYAQSVLSGVKTLPSMNRNSIQFQSAGLNRHRLSFQAPEAGDASAQEFTLSSVQLFDLIEAIDQLLSDPQTLPDLSRTLEPISKRYVHSSHPITEQVVPAAIGVTSLAVAAIALSLLPAPEIQRPADTLAKPPSPEATKPAQPITITDPVQLETLQQQLYKTVNEAWKEGVPSEPAVYRLTVDENARVLGYEPQSDLAREELDKTPLLNVLKLAKAGGSLSPTATAAFEVTFDPNGRLDVRPWQATPQATSTPTSEPSETTP
jgi:hypothetical protein